MKTLGPCSEEYTSELQSRRDIVCRLLLATIDSGHATLATKQDATLYLGRTFTGWIAPALPGALIRSPRRSCRTQRVAELASHIPRQGARTVHDSGPRSVTLPDQTSRKRY